MKKFLLVIISFIYAMTGVVYGQKISPSQNHSKYAYLNSLDNRLKYAPIDEYGGRMTDFSYCGYKGGGVGIPYVRTLITIKPSGIKDGRDIETIQSAINKLSESNLDKQGFRGAILLKKGDWFLDTTIYIEASGIILRGETGTILNAFAKTNGTLIHFGKEGAKIEELGERYPISDYFPTIGDNKVGVADASSFKIGERIIIQRKTNKQWVADLNMDKIAPRIEGDITKPWSTGWRERYERTVTAIDGNIISVNISFPCTLLEKHGGGAVYKFESPLRIYNCGLENLSLVSEWKPDSNGFDPRNHFENGIVAANIENGWISGCKLENFYWTSIAVKEAYQFTVQNCDVSIPAPSYYQQRGYYSGTGFSIVHGQMVLILRCKTGLMRHPYNFSSRIGGPNAVVYCDGTGDSELHDRYSVGVLWDNCGLISPVTIGLMNRSWMGSGHGWAAANSVLWNCVGNDLNVESSAIDKNIAIGCIMKYRKPGYSDIRCYESTGRFVEPQSLYVQQLTERLGEKAVLQVFPKSRMKKYLSNYQDILKNGINNEITERIPYEAYQIKPSDYKNSELNKYEGLLKKAKTSDEKIYISLEMAKIYHARKNYEIALQLYHQIVNVGTGNNKEMASFLRRRILIELSNKLIYEMAPAENNCINLAKFFKIMDHNSSKDLMFLEKEAKNGSNYDTSIVNIYRNLMGEADQNRQDKLYYQAYHSYQNIVNALNVHPHQKSEALLKMAWIQKILNRYELACDLYKEILTMEYARPYDRRIVLKDLFADFDFDPEWAEKYREMYEL